MKRLEMIDPQKLYWKVVHVVEHGHRTSTYKLATMTALVDFSVRHRPTIAASVLEVTIPELARRVMGLYWDQLKPFNGGQLRQSTQPRSRIFEAIESVRSAAGPGEDLTMEVAARMAPAVFRRAVDTVGLCLAQQPLPRIQRAATSARSDPFLYDDSFLHDNVTRNELERHRNAIELNPGIAHGLAVYQNQLRRVLQITWADDVIRINRISRDESAKVEEHLFGRVLRAPSPKVTAADERTKKSGRTDSDRGISMSTFASQLNDLFDTVRPACSSGEVATEIRKSGFPISVSIVSQLRSGLGPAPSKGTIEALAKFFGVEPAYFLGDGFTGNLASEEHALPTTADSANRSKTESAPRLPQIDTAPVGQSSTVSNRLSAPPHNVQASTTGTEIWGQGIGDDIDDIAAACEIQPDGCWIAPSNSAVRCRPRGDTRSSVDLPKIALHRWAWMVVNGYSGITIPSYLIQIRRTCSSSMCCNPEHLIAAAPGGEELSRNDVASLLRKSYVSSRGLTATTTGDADDGSIPQGRLVLQDDLAAMKDYCSVEGSGCWIAPNASPVACRANGDNRKEDDLPMLAPHRWVWMIVHDRSSDPLPGNLFHVRRRCGQQRCCNPDHLYLTTPQGQEFTSQQVERLLRLGERRDRGESITSEMVGPRRELGHRIATASAGAGAGSGISNSPRDVTLFADLLNKLFEKSGRSGGIPYTAGQVAAALQEDGLTVSESLITRLRAGAGDVPSLQTVDALAYFFNVDSDYFSAGANSAEVVDSRPNDVHRLAEAELTSALSSALSPAPRVQVIHMSVIDLGHIVAGLSEATSECLTQHPSNIHVATRLLALLTDVGALLSLPSGGHTIGRPLLQRIVKEWGSVGRNPKHERLLNRLSALADGD